MSDTFVPLHQTILTCMAKFHFITRLNRLIIRCLCFFRDFMTLCGGRGQSDREIFRPFLFNIIKQPP